MSKLKKKALLMGRSGSGKTSMRSIIFSNQVAQDTRRLGATIDVEATNIKFLGEISLNLWDCGGQESFMDSFLSSQRDSIFRDVHSLIYIFDVESSQFSTLDMHYFAECLSALRANSGAPKSTSSAGPMVHVLIHKMDLVPTTSRQEVFAKRSEEIRSKCREYDWQDVRIFATSIWDETLYKAWSHLVSTFIPNVNSIRSHLTRFAGLCQADEVVLFERTTFLVISRSTLNSDEPDSLSVAQRRPPTSEQWEAERFAKISQFVKTFRLSCSTALRSSFQTMEIKEASYSAVFEVLTANTYILVVSTNPDVQPAGLLLNIKLARPHFARLQETSWGLQCQGPAGQAGQVASRASGDSKRRGTTHFCESHSRAHMLDRGPQPQPVDPSAVYKPSPSQRIEAFYAVASGSAPNDGMQAETGPAGAGRTAALSSSDVQISIDPKRQATGGAETISNRSSSGMTDEIADGSDQPGQNRHADTSVTTLSSSTSLNTTNLQTALSPPPLSASGSTWSQLFSPQGYQGREMSPLPSPAVGGSSPHQESFGTRFFVDTRPYRSASVTSSNDQPESELLSSASKSRSISGSAAPPSGKKTLDFFSSSTTSAVMPPPSVLSASAGSVAVSPAVNHGTTRSWTENIEPFIVTSRPNSPSLSQLFLSQSTSSATELAKSPLSSSASMRGSASDSKPLSSNSARSRRSGSPDGSYEWQASAITHPPSRMPTLLHHSHTSTPGRRSAHAQSLAIAPDDVFTSKPTASRPMYSQSNVATGSAVTPGTMLNKRFLVTRLAGKGAFSRVVIADDQQSNGSSVAIKLVDRQSYSRNERMKISVQREVEVLRHIRHPSLVHLLTTFESPTDTCLVLEACHGGELFDFLKDHHVHTSEALARRIVGELSEAVRWMHSIGLVHRDIKLENVLLTCRPFESVPGLPMPPPDMLPDLQTPFVKLTDFGLSRFIDFDAPLLETRCGSEEYAAPELIMGKKYDGRQTDAWALGVVMYAILTGVLPFVEEKDTDEAANRGRRAYLMKIAKGDYRWPETTYEGDTSDENDVDDASRLATPEARQIVEALLVRNPGRRSTIEQIMALPWMSRGAGMPTPIEPDDCLVMRAPSDRLLREEHA
ncbi:uncharacterized protein L969DRAFT_80274 [Mixia osmundae IAM 14324]|uniref:Protein kinase domain-containing protein n=1 Tax=Mixia osmundae (strain CBS 9802 / IAM 14324 / JCM 22182 / KY 12970) TaxID=764103 RepID=G7DUM2_MIXOS|nr:uncharacterized protein L969DRAFT_80274 [Mixia osmundae IAM 14324]KEI36384.1 hypothetical protein L969DRAFT_80274 [Mixia osmundae IAM 14324]GAA94282.1 hypothetical protein E5Q_00931 [Mixia osmundae IAM 14324]